MRCLINPGMRPSTVPAPSREAAAFHAALSGYQPSALRDLPSLATELGLAALMVKDESERLGLPSFKVLGASWAIERALSEYSSTHTVVAASAGNHGRAVARVAALRGLACRVFVPARCAAARRDAITAEGAQLTVVDGTYEDAVSCAAAEGTRDGVLELADVGDSKPAEWVIDGYATLFGELPANQAFDLICVPVGVGSLAAAATRYGVHAGAIVVGAEPTAAACLTAALVAGEPTAIPTPGTTMAGLDCAQVSAAAWPTLRDGIHAAVTIEDAEAYAAMRELAAVGLVVGESGAAPLAALRVLVGAAGCAALRAAVGLGSATRALLVATEGPTDPASYHRIVSADLSPDRGSAPQ